MKFRGTGSNKLKIIFLTLILLVLFIVPGNAKAEDIKESYLDTGVNVKSKLRRLSHDYNASNGGPIFRKATEEEYDAVDKGSFNADNRLSLSNSPYPTYAWSIDIDEKENLVYYSEADKIYLNPNSSQMFYYDGYYGILYSSIDISGLDASKATNMEKMFSSFSGNESILKEVYLGDFDVRNVTNMSSLFASRNKLEKLDYSSFKTSDKLTNIMYMFSNCSSLTSLDLSDFDTSNVTYMINMFSSCSSLTSLDLSGFDTSNVTNMSNMFYGCSSLTELDLSNFDTTNVTNMSGMFSGCSSLTSLDLSNFDTSNVKNVDKMFRNMNNVENIDLSSFELYDITSASMSLLFENCFSLKSIDLSGFDTSNITDMNSMFRNCYSLTTLDLSNFNTSNVINMNMMFEGSRNLQTIFVSELFATDKVQYSDNMFYNCNNLYGQQGSHYVSGGINGVIYAKVDDAENGNPGNFTYKDYKPRIFYPDGTIERVDYGYLFTFPSNSKDDEALATVTFNYHDGVTPSTTSNVTRQYTFNNWRVRNTEYEPSDTITVRYDIHLKTSYIQTTIGAEFPEDPVIENNTFLGWFDEISGGNEYESYNEVGDITLYAHWENPISDNNLNITSITIVNGTLTPGFDNSLNNYDIKLSNDFENEDLIINVQPESEFTTVTGNGIIDPSQNSFDVTLTSEAGNTRNLSFNIIQNIRLEKYDYTLNEGEIEEIIVTSGIDASKLAVSVENEEIANINDLFITAIETGRTTARVSLKNDNSIYRDINISVDGDELKSYIYEISAQDNKIVMGVNPRTKVIDFKNNLENENENLFIYDEDSLLGEDDLVKTGSTVKLINNNEEKDLATVVVKGDINKDGKVNIKDESLLFDDAKVGKKLTSYEKIAADLDDTDLVDETDLTKIHDYILNRNKKINLRKLTIDPKGGTINGNSNIQTITQSEDTITLDNPEKEGYTFDKWKLSGSGSIDGKIYTFGEGNGTLKANYKAPKEITLFDSNGPNSFTLNNRALVLKIGDNTNLSSLSMNIELDINEKIEYSYVYGTRANGSVTIYDGEDEVFKRTYSGSGTATGVNGKDSFENTGVKKTYKVVFSSNSTTHTVKILTKNDAKAALTTKNVLVTYKLNDGTITGSITDIKTIGSEYGTLPTPQKNHYAFDGWYLNSDFSGDKVTGSTIVTNTSNHTLYAKYIFTSYILTIDPNGGTYSGTNPVIGDPQETTTVTKPSRSDYLFNGWTLSGTGSITDNASTNQTFTFGAGDATLTTKWVSNTKKVSGGTFNISGTSVSLGSCNSSPTAELTLLPGESVTYKVTSSTSTMGGSGGGFSVNNSTVCSASAGSTCNATYTNSTSSSQVVKIGIGCSNASATGTMSNVKTKYGETYTLTK